MRATGTERGPSIVRTVRDPLRPGCREQLGPKRRARLFSGPGVLNGEIYSDPFVLRRKRWLRSLGGAPQRRAGLRALVYLGSGFKKKELMSSGRDGELIWLEVNNTV